MNTTLNIAQLAARTPASGNRSLAALILGVAGVSAGIGLRIRGSLMSTRLLAAPFSTGCVLLGAFGLEGRRRA